MTTKISKILGVIFILVGLLGLVSNPIVGSGAIFHTNLMHNLVHLLIGAILLWASTSAHKAGKWMKILGAVYLLVAILGFISSSGMVLGIVEVNTADNWLHVVLGLVLLFAGMKKEGTMVPPMTSNSPMGGMPNNTPSM